MDLGTMYANLRNYAEGNQALLQQILDELKKLNSPAKTTTQRDMGNIGPIDAATGEPVRLPTKLPADAVGPATVETVQTIDTGKGEAKGMAEPRSYPPLKKGR